MEAAREKIVAAKPAAAKSMMAQELGVNTACTA